ncbi:hypothetical protein [Paludibacterium denitrificans]|uniref:Uncharacterized protein n=1 Tax=Paludibacterium denitrificans TaxID=2675226 RepID=A0A844GB13_9NEIS|nr:hypothetical protein [Paludibacterium denitrificans]MTD32540.1 hypothetical protein [Paludibacterium denitrificans]
MKLTKEQKQELIEKLSHPLGQVRLLCDGYKVDLVVERTSALGFKIVTYVNGYWKGEWMSADKPHPEQKFMNKKFKPYVSKAKLAKLEKEVGKRVFKKHIADDPFYTGGITLYDVTWASGRTAINHLCKVCDSIQIAPEEVTV